MRGQGYLPNGHIPTLNKNPTGVGSFSFLEWKNSQHKHVGQISRVRARALDALMWSHGQKHPAKLTKNAA